MPFYKEKKSLASTTDGTNLFHWSMPKRYWLFVPFICNYTIFKCRHFYVMWRNYAFLFHLYDCFKFSHFTFYICKITPNMCAYILPVWRRGREPRRETERRMAMSLLQDGLTGPMKSALHLGETWKYILTTANIRSIMRQLIAQTAMKWPMSGQQSLTPGNRKTW